MNVLNKNAQFRMCLGFVDWRFESAGFVYQTKKIDGYLDDIPFDSTTVMKMDKSWIGLIGGNWTYDSRPTEFASSYSLELTGPDRSSTIFLRTIKSQSDASHLGTESSRLPPSPLHARLEAD